MNKPFFVSFVIGLVWLTFPLSAQAASFTIKFATPNDPLYAQQSYLGQIGLPQAWGVTTGSSIPIAVIDTGIDLFHEDLVDKLWVNSDEIPSNGIDDDKNGYIDDYHGYNFLNHNTNLSDVHGHGTGIASVIAGATNNGKGMAGVNWQAKIMVAKTLNAVGGGDFVTVAEAIRYATDNGARIINMSFGSLDNVSTLSEAVSYALSKKVVVVAAVGNSNGLGVYYPANYPDVIGVSSIDDTGRLSSFSNYGSGVDLAAPGENILVAGSSANSVSSFIRASGSSFAAALVTGVASLLLARDPNLTPADVHSVLSETADKLTGETTPGEFFGAGRVNAGLALTYKTKTFIGKATVSNPKPAADGLTKTIVTIVVTDSASKPQFNLPIYLTISGNGNIISNKPVVAGQSVLLGTTDQLGRIAFTVSSDIAEIKTLSFVAGFSPIELTPPLSINFGNVAQPFYKMSWVAQSPPVTMTVGSDAPVWIEVRNDSNVVWTSGESLVARGQIKLGTDQKLDRNSSFYDSSTWLSPNRVAYMTPTTVRPGEVARFTFNLHATKVGKFKEYFRPVAEFLTWVKGPKIYLNITVTQ